MHRDLPLWRSSLFVPANVERYIAKAHLRGADAIILDLEDSVPLAQKTEARENIAAAALRVKQGGGDVIVRINQPWRLAVRDLEAAIGPNVRAICVPKVSCAAQMQFVSEVITELEIERELPAGHTGLIALIESPEALKQLDAIAASSPRMLGMILGPEDFTASVGMETDREGLLFPNQQIVFAARQAGILPLGFVGSIGDFRDRDAFRETIRFSRRLGFRGGFCIHPDQVTIMNEEFGPSDAEMENARALLAVFETRVREGRGSAEFKGKMIDEPVVARARELVAMGEAIASREAASEG